MRVDLLPKDSYKLLALADEVADALSGGPQEAPMRASIASVRFTRRAYRAVRNGAMYSTAAYQFIVPARIARARAEHHLRCRLSRHFAELCRLMEEQIPVGV